MHVHIMCKPHSFYTDYLPNVSATINMCFTALYRPPSVLDPFCKYDEAEFEAKASRGCLRLEVDLLYITYCIQPYTCSSLGIIMVCVGKSTGCLLHLFVIYLSLLQSTCRAPQRDHNIVNILPSA